MGRCLNNQANLLKKQGKLEAAEALYERTVAIRTHALGDSPDTANALYNLALLYEMEGKLADAEVRCDSCEINTTIMFVCGSTV